MIGSLLSKYRNKYKYLDYRKTESFEVEVMDFIDENGLDFSDFKRVVKFIKDYDMDDSSIGLMMLFDKLNIALSKILVDDLDKKWEWLKENCMKEDDLYLEVILNSYTDLSYQEEVKELLQQDLFYYYHSKEYYNALYLRNIHSPDYESYLDEHIKSSDIKKLKAIILVDRNQVTEAFDLMKDDSNLVLDASKLLEGEAKEKYLVGKILQEGKREWWNYLFEIAGNKYLDAFMDSDKCIELVNDQLYELKEYEKLMHRIDTGMCHGKYDSVMKYKKLKKLYPNQCAVIIINTGVYYMERANSRTYYHRSANTIARGAKLSEHASQLARQAAYDLAKAYPNRKVMIEELRLAGLL